MLLRIHRRTRDDAVRFCDACAQVSTRAERRYQHTRATPITLGRLG
ncbi:hypothetical protein [Actinoplanes sp. NPDC049802]